MKIASLRSARDFRQVLTSGRAARRGALSVRVAPGPGPGPRLGLSVRAPSGAVARNRARRRLREAFARCAPAAAVDVVVRAPEGINRVPFQKLVEDLCEALRRAGASR